MHCFQAVWDPGSLRRFGAQGHVKCLTAGPITEGLPQASNSLRAEGPGRSTLSQQPGKQDRRLFLR